MLHLGNPKVCHANSVHHGDMAQPHIHCLLKTRSDDPWSVLAPGGPVRSRMQKEKINNLPVTLYGHVKDLFWFLIN